MATITQISNRLNVITNNMIQYKTVIADNADDLDTEVSNLLNDGWMMHGPQYQNHFKQYVQPLIKIPNTKIK